MRAWAVPRMPVQRLRHRGAGWRWAGNQAAGKREGQQNDEDKQKGKTGAIHDEVLLDEKMGDGKDGFTCRDQGRQRGGQRDAGGQTPVR